MTTEYLKIIFDLLILAGLGGFIFYALKLSRALNAFRAHRNEFDAIMKDLTKHIDDAQIAVNELKETSQSSGDDLHKLIRDAQHLSDELQQINDISESLASRLENAAERSRGGLERSDREYGDEYGDNVSSISRPKKSKNNEFMIHDPDFGDDEDPQIDNDPEAEKLSSAAERDLFRALKKKRK